MCENKMPTTRRSNRGFYCRSYCLLNMFRAPLCPSSGAQEYYTVVAACGIWCCGFQVVGLMWSWGLCVRFAASCCLWYLVLWFSSCWSGVELRVMCPVCSILLSVVFRAVVFKLLVWCGAEGYMSGLQHPAVCSISCCGFQVVGLVWSWGLYVRFAASCCL